jgi:hypothetical protein
MSEHERLNGFLKGAQSLAKMMGVDVAIVGIAKSEDVKGRMLAGRMLSLNGMRAELLLTQLEAIAEDLRENLRQEREFTGIVSGIEKEFSGNAAEKTWKDRIFSFFSKNV